MGSRKLIGVVVCVLALVSACSSGNRDASASDTITTLQPGVLKVCMYPGFAPFVSKQNGEWTGWDVTYMQQFAQQAGLQFQPVEVKEFNNIWMEPGKGTCDVAASGIAEIEQREKQTGAAAQWSDHYYRVARSFGINEKDTLDDIHQLAGKTVIVTKGSTADIDLQSRLKMAGITNTKVEYTNDEAHAAQRVVAGDAFAYGGGLGSVQYLTGQVPGLKLAWEHCLMLSDGQQVPEPFSFVARTASTGLVEAINSYVAHPTQPYQGGAGADIPCPPQ